MFKCVSFDVNHAQGPPGQKGDQGATEIIDYNGNIQEALQVRQAQLLSLTLNASVPIRVEDRVKVDSSV